jgi:YD repeat-containing protein
MALPGGYKHSITHDKAGRIASVLADDGHRTDYVHGTGLGLSQVTMTAAGGFTQTQAFKVDALGRAVEAGLGKGDAYRAQWRKAYDTANRLQWHANAIGWMQQTKLNSEGQRVEQASISPAIVRKQRWDDAAVAPSSEMAGEPLAAAEPSTVAHRSDDFGRVVVTASLDSGLIVRQFDEADRLIGMRDALNNVATYEHDAAGRIVKQSTRAPDVEAKAEPTVTTWHYQGRQLIKVEHPTQSEQYTYNANGWRVLREVTIKADASVPHATQTTVQTRYEVGPANPRQPA